MIIGACSTRIEELAEASDADLAGVEIIGAGFALHWPARDADISLQGLMNGLFGTRRWKRTGPPCGTKPVAGQGRSGAGEWREGRTAEEGGMSGEISGLAPQFLRATMLKDRTGG